MAGISGTEDTDKKDDIAQKCTREKLERPADDTPHMNGADMNGGTDSPQSELSDDSPSTENSSQEEGERTTDEDEKKTEVDGKGDAKTDDQEVVLIQETGFVVKLSIPGGEDFDLPVSSMELVQEIHQVLVDREESCHRTCFSLQLDNVALDNFAELKTIEGLKEGSVIKVVEEPYTIREARIHVRHIRDLLKSVDPADAYGGADCASLSFLNTVTCGDILDKKRSKPDSIDCTPPDYIMPNAKERPILPLHPGIKDLKGPNCIKVLTYSGWNPPPGNRRMHGDLLYIYVVTLEEKKYHITASTRGFYVNQSTEDEFNPKAAQQKFLSHSLIDLLIQVSPAFKKNFSILLKKRAQKHPFERVPTPYQIYSWMAPLPEHSVDYIRAEDAFSTRLGYEEHIPGQTREWNEEVQTTQELPRKTLPDRLIRERAIFKVHSDFVGAATRGATAVIDGNVMAINPGEEAKMQMFIWNNIFFSLGFDVRDHYKEFGGDAAAYSAPGNDLQGVKAYFNLDHEGLYTLGTVIVDYRGYRITAQSIIPGILEREQEQSVVYGSIDFGKTVVTDEKYQELLSKTATFLKVRPHKVVNDKGEEVELFTSLECKGIIGNDRRYYVLDLLRTSPPDVNFLSIDKEELSAAMREHGFPREHRHRLACLRQELVEAFVEAKYVTFVRHAAINYQHLQLKRQGKAATEAKAATTAKLTNGHSDEEKPLEDKEENLVSEEDKKLVKVLTSTDQAEQADQVSQILPGIDVKTLEEDTKDVVKKAAKVVNSLSDTEFNITFNPDVYQAHVKHANPESETLRREKQLVKDAAEFLVVYQIPSLISDCMDHTSSPIDGSTLTEAMHTKGINMRYLGKVAEMLTKYPSVSYVHTIAVGELITRATKHLFKTYMQGVEMMSLSSAVSHFLNCFLGSHTAPHAQLTAEELQSKKARRKNIKKNKAAIFNMDNVEWVLETPKTLWKKVVEEVKDYFYFTVECDSVDGALEKYGLQRVSMLREICRSCGMQILLREYNLESRNKQIFYEDDIINIFPKVKHIHPKASDAYHFFTSGQAKIQQGLMKEGYDLISEALNLLNNVYGAMHPEISACLRLMARLNYILGDYGEALSYQQRAVLMSERVQGLDHPNTITEYSHLALYCFANNQVSSSLRLMYRTRYLALLCHGEDHPEVALIDSNIGLILHAVEEYELSLRFLEHALQLNQKFHRKLSLKVAMSYHLVARTHSCRGDFRAALQTEKEAYVIYKQMLGEEHDRTKESSDCLKHLTQQAVVFQKKMNEIYKGEKSITLPPLQIQTPSIASVMETLNAINGIVFVQISPNDLDKIKQQMGQTPMVSAPIIIDKTNGQDSTPEEEQNKSEENDTENKENMPKDCTAPKCQGDVAEMKAKVKQQSQVIQNPEVVANGQ
ncbi:clustered mitochondria protein homolog isoform X2 [Mizuhopecten yessoensis]|uniref:clustered mitochondria protein homolog isoform X2 n=1 Tax=Mizuhopecten yessoensis TaxID=6573 RepID=UPI000B459591|nr:clustered mitochondria protein homolog isoform X2 [Mizuhopecten yessoensis]